MLDFRQHLPFLMPAEGNCKEDQYPTLEREYLKRRAGRVCDVEQELLTWCTI
jgi:hypothetical protein